MSRNRLSRLPEIELGKASLLPFDQKRMNRTERIEHNWSLKSGGKVNLVGMMLLNLPGKTRFLGVPIECEGVPIEMVADQKPSWVFRIAPCLIFEHARMTIHALGHALTSRLLTGHQCLIKNGLIADEEGTGAQSCPVDAAIWKKSIILFSGPSASLLVSGTTLVAVAALKRYIPQVVLVPLLTSILFSAVLEIGTSTAFPQTCYRIFLRKYPYAGLAVSTLLVSQIVLNSFMILRLLRR